MRLLVATIRAANGDGKGAKDAEKIELVSPPSAGPGEKPKRKVRYFPAEKVSSMFSAV